MPACWGGAGITCLFTWLQAAMWPIHTGMLWLCYACYACEPTHCPPCSVPAPARRRPPTARAWPLWPACCCFMCQRSPPSSSSAACSGAAAAPAPARADSACARLDTRFAPFVARPCLPRCHAYALSRVPVHARACPPQPFLHSPRPRPQHQRAQPAPPVPAGAGGAEGGAEEAGLPAGAPPARPHCAPQRKLGGRACACMAAGLGSALCTTSADRLQLRPLPPASHPPCRPRAWCRCCLPASGCSPASPAPSLWASPAAS